MDKYTAQAEKFLADTGAKITCVKLGTFPYFEDDKESRDVFQITLTRGNKSYSFRFGCSMSDTLDHLLAANIRAGSGCQLVPTQALFRHTHTKNAHQFYEWCTKNAKRLHAVPKEPTAYSVLACLTKYDPGSFKNFCADFGYDTDSMKAHKTYQAVQDEFEGVCSLFNADEREKLGEIQ